MSHNATWLHYARVTAGYTENTYVQEFSPSIMSSEKQRMGKDKGEMSLHFNPTGFRGSEEDST